MASVEIWCILRYSMDVKVARAEMILEKGIDNKCSQKRKSAYEL